MEKLLRQGANDGDLCPSTTILGCDSVVMKNVQGSIYIAYIVHQTGLMDWKSKGKQITRQLCIRPKFKPEFWTDLRHH